MPTKRKRTKVRFKLEELVKEYQSWNDSDSKVNELTTAKEAATAVSLALSEQGVSYDRSLNEWSRWHERALACKDRDKLCHDILTTSIPDEMQLAKLTPKKQPLELPHPDLQQALKRLLPGNTAGGRSRKEARELASLLVTQVEHDYDGEQFDIRWVHKESGKFYLETTGVGEEGLELLIWRLWNLAKNNTRAITLSLRVKQHTRLEEVCHALDHYYEMTNVVCPKSHWTLGPSGKQAQVESQASATDRNYRLPADKDPRFYLIVGTPGAVTRSHWDRGVQAVLYHTVASTNHALEIPRQLALQLQAVDDGLDAKDASWSLNLEYQALKGCPIKRAGTFEVGETMLITPGGGHAVLTGNDGKVVLAGEWHLRTDC